MNVKIPSLIHIGGQDINIEIVDISDLFQCDINLYNYRTKEI